MAVERSPAGTSLVDVLDRVLDKGIVIDAYIRVSLVGIDLVSIEARIVVASVETYLRYADAISTVGMVARPLLREGDLSRRDGELSRRDGDLSRLLAENEVLRQELAISRGHEREIGREG